MNSEGTQPEEGETGLLFTSVPSAPSAVLRLTNTCFFLVPKMMNEGADNGVRTILWVQAAGGGVLVS